jgi:serine/threonine-protein kinase RsbW
MGNPAAVPSMGRMDAPNLEQITVAVPANGARVHVLRAVTAAVASRMRMSFDAIEDLRLAVDEASAWLIGTNPGAGSLILRLVPLDDRLEAVVAVDIGDGAWPPPDVEQGLPWRILTALVDTLALGTDPSEPSISLGKRTLEPTAAT